MHRFCLLATAFLAVSSVGSADEKQPTFSFDPYRRTGAISGECHTHNALLDLNKWTWCFAIAIVDGEARNPVLTVSTDTPEWYFFESAADVDGKSLNVLPGARDIIAPDDVHETVGIELTPEYVRVHRVTGMNIKLMGSRGDIVLQIPAEAVSTFADGAVAIFSKLAAPARP